MRYNTYVYHNMILLYSMYLVRHHYLLTYKFRTLRYMKLELIGFASLLPLLNICSFDLINS